MSNTILSKETVLIIRVQKVKGIGDKKKMVNRRKIIIPAVCICTVGIYIAGMKHYEKVFLPGTKVAGISVSGLSVEGAVNKVNAELPKHAVLVKERDREEKVSAEDVGL